MSSREIPEEQYEAIFAKYPEMLNFDREFGGLEILSDEDEFGHHEYDVVCRMFGLRFSSSHEQVIVAFHGAVEEVALYMEEIASDVRRFGAANVTVEGHA